MGDFFFQYQADLRSIERSKRDGLALQSAKLDFESHSFFVNVNHGANIAGFELLRRKICFQSDPVVFLDHRILLDRIGRD